MSSFFDGAAAVAKQRCRMNEFFEDESIGVSQYNRPRFKILVYLL